MEDALVKMSRKYGSDPAFVMAGGGNTSVKTEDVLTVKASGFRLADIDLSGFVRLDRHKLAAMWKKDYGPDTDKRESGVLDDLMASRLPGETSRPSVESQLHDLMPHTYVLHLHPALVNGLTCAKDGKAWTEKLFGDNVLWIEATKPGYILAMTCKDKIMKHVEKTGITPDTLLLENHGVFFSADTTEEIDILVNNLTDTLNRHAGPEVDMSGLEPDMATMDLSRRRISEALPEMHICFEYNDAIRDMLGNPERASDVRRALTPDHIVYCRHEPLMTTPDDIKKDIRTYSATNGFEPRIIFVKGAGMFAVADSMARAVNARDLFLDQIRIARHAKAFGGVKPMTDEDTAFILNWEVEHYRISMGRS